MKGTLFSTWQRSCRFYPKISLLTSKVASSPHPPPSDSVGPENSTSSMFYSDPTPPHPTGSSQSSFVERNARGSPDRHEGLRFVYSWEVERSCVRKPWRPLLSPWLRIGTVSGGFRRRRPAARSLQARSSLRASHLSSPSPSGQGRAGPGLVGEETMPSPRRRPLLSFLLGSRRSF